MKVVDHMPCTKWQDRFYDATGCHWQIAAAGVITLIGVVLQAVF
jgi:hypothetical protein